MARSRVNLVKILVLGALIVSVYVIIAHVSGLNQPVPQDRKKIETFGVNTISSSVPTNTTGDEEMIQLKGLNQHMWENQCLKSFERLCNYPVFPKAPAKRKFVKNIQLNSAVNGVDGLRLLGFLRPNVTGDYLFLLASNGFAELWLSTDKKWKNGRKIAYAKPPMVSSNRMDFVAMKSHISSSIRLVKKQIYYIEVIYAQGAQTGFRSGPSIEVAWKRPDKSDFEIIDNTFFSPYTNDSDKAEMKVYDDDLPDALACEQVRQSFANKYMRPEKLPILESTMVREALDFCEYKPSYLLDPANLPVKFGQYHGVYGYAHTTYSFPYTNVDGITRNPRVEKAFIAENPLEEKEARSVVNRYMVALQKKYPGTYKLETIKRVEYKPDLQKGGRYLLDLVVKDLTDDRKYILSEYVFQPNKKSANLCYPKGLQWNRTADVYLILTAKNLGRWVHHFIKNAEKIVQQTKDEHLHVVIFDFNSPDIDLKQALQRSTLKNYHYITRPGKYSRTRSFSEAIQSIKDPNAIVVTVDLHLDLGSQLINDVRKHCSKGKTVYAPQIVFLHCGGSSALPSGVWYHMSYGTIAMYKQDWLNFGGFSAKFANKITWGGEDWDIIDNFVKGGLEIERKRSPWIYHYYHTKTGMW